MNSYIGRFAPSPTGSLHMGSLVAAVGSYLRAKSNQGKWLVRMEDLDPLREVEGAADEILRSLESHGLYWDGKLVYQSQREEVYQHALSKLITVDQVYACTCTRKGLKKIARFGSYGMIYPGTCRASQRPFLDPDYKVRHAIRVCTHDEEICFDDKRLASYCQKLKSQLGDFIIKRSDGYFAYQFAVVVDDHEQGITEVCRGEDLLDNTQRQIHLQNLLGYQRPDYYHLPMVTNQQGQKLSKQTHAPPIQNDKAGHNLIQALTFLGVYNSKNAEKGLEYPLEQEPPEVILEWSVVHSNL